MTRSELVQRISEKVPHLYQVDVEKVVLTIFDKISDSLEQGQRVELRGFGAFVVKERKSRTSRNPRTGQTLEVDAKQVPFFKAGKHLKSRLNSSVTR